MTERKLQAILDALQGITKSEWKKLCFAVSQGFYNEQIKLDKELTLNSIDTVEYCARRDISFS